LGKVKDLGYDPEGRIVIIYDNVQGVEEAVPSNQILAIGDVILVKTREQADVEAKAPHKTEKTCPKCGKANAPDVRFCTACGSRLE